MQVAATGSKPVGHPGSAIAVVAFATLPVKLAHRFSRVVKAGLAFTKEWLMNPDPTELCIRRARDFWDTAQRLCVQVGSVVMLVCSHWRT